jgi:ketosteroid isomerase-like protein
MSANDNTKTIQRVYEAFGRGDLATILDSVTDDVDWSSEASDPALAPWYGVRHGRDAVAAFFEAFGSTMGVDDFTPIAFGSNDTDVFAIVRMTATSRATGRSVTMQLHHWFQFRDGKIAYYRGTEDTAAMAAAQ